MKLEEYCMEKGYGISEINLKQKMHYPIFEHSVLYKGDIVNLIPKKTKNLKDKVEEKIILKNGNKRIVFAKGWNEQCHGSALFLKGDFYIAIDGHSDFKYLNEDKSLSGIPTRQHIYWCGDYRNFVLENCVKNKREFYIITTQKGNTNGSFVFDKLMPYTRNELFLDYNDEDLKDIGDDISLALNNIKKHLKNKKGVLCIDPDILHPNEMMRYNLINKTLEKTWAKKDGICFEELKTIVKEIINDAEILTLFVDVPYERKDFLEEMLK